MQFLLSIDEKQCSSLDRWLEGIRLPGLGLNIVHVHAKANLRMQP
jgi:hypothetical protein